MYLSGVTPGQLRRDRLGPEPLGREGTGKPSPVPCTSEDGQAIKDILSIPMTH